MKILVFFDITQLSLGLCSCKLLRRLMKRPFELDIHVSPPLSESHFKAMFKILERQHEIRLLSKIIDISYIYEKESEGKFLQWYSYYNPCRI